MTTQIIRREDQADGQFNGGAVREKRPVFYQKAQTFPYSNLFYWAHAWSDKGSTIGLHPHQGFEILSFVLKGEIEHYDTKNKTWLKLKAGDVQIIRSGNGISHAEKLLPGSAIFQIWFDPNLDHSMQQPATYDDYMGENFPVEKKNGISTVVFKGEGAPIAMDTEGVNIKKIILETGKHQLTLTPTSIYSIFIMEGALKIGMEHLNKEDFFKLEDSDAIELNCSEPSTLFMIESPAKPSYPTYVESHL